MKEVAMIRRKGTNDFMEAGFFNRETGEFRTDCKIESEADIEKFLDAYDLSTVCISNM